MQQQVVKRRIKRDYKPSYPGPVQSSMAQSSSIYFNDAKWSSMWYIVSILNQHAVHRSSELLTLKNTSLDLCHGLFFVSEITDFLLMLAKAHKTKEKITLFNLFVKLFSQYIFSLTPYKSHSDQ